MNSFSKKVLMALALLSFSGAAFGYSWTFTNVTDRPLVVEFRLLAHGQVYYDIINPGQNTTRFEWPIGSLKAGFCVERFIIGELSDNDLRNLFGKATFPTAQEIYKACTEDANKRAILARVGKRELAIKWIPGEKWGTFEKASMDAVNALSKSVGDIGGEAANLAAAAGAEVATGGTTAGTAGTLAAKLNLGKIFDSLSSIPGSVMTLAEKSKCRSRSFVVTKDAAGSLMIIAKT